MEIVLFVIALALVGVAGYKLGYWLMSRALAKKGE